MTPSSTPEPELETQPTKADPKATVDQTVATPVRSTDVEGGSEVTKTEAATKTEAGPETEVPESEPVAETVPVATGEPVAQTVSLTEDKPAEDKPGEDEPGEDEPAGDVQEASSLQPEAQAPAGSPEYVTPEYDEDETDEEIDYEEILASEPSNRYPTLVPLIGSLLGLTAIAALILVAFALPAVKSTPNRLPIGVSGTAEFQSQVRQALSQDGLTPFKVTGYTEDAKLRAAIEDRKIYGGLSLGDASITMLVSSGASPLAAQTLSSLASSLAEGGIPVTDLAELPDSDPRGDGLAAANLPLVIAAILPALILIPIYRRRPGAQLAITAGAAVLIGLGLSAVLSFAIGSTEDSNFLLVSAGLAAGVLATSLVLLGLFAVAGRVGAGVGVALLVLFAAPLSALSSAPEWLPTPWGSIGQLLPPGANATLLRSTAYFDGNGGGKPLLVLAGWALLGLLLLGLGVLLQRRRSQAPLDQEHGVQELRLEEPVAV